MLFSRFGAALAAAAAALFTTALAQVNQTQSTFVAVDGQLSFGIIAPADEDETIYFTLRVHRSRAWGAVGLGSSSMANSLILMIYEDALSENVTFSPRLATGTFEPAYLPGLRIETLNGTGLDNTHMTLSARCTEGCRSWSGGVLDPSSAAFDAIYALGPREALRSDQPDAWLPMHREYGSLRIDLARTGNSTGAPILTSRSRTEGATAGAAGNYRREWKSTFHAVSMVVVFVGMLPAGALMIQLGHWARLHAMNQVLALLLFLVGAGLGMATSPNFQRSRLFRSPHQILGIVIMIFLLAQFVLGFLHHRQWKQTKQPTKLAVPHRWLGRVIMLMGIVNAFLGFRFALNGFYNYILTGLVIAVAGLALVLIFGKRWIRKVKGDSKNDGTGPFQDGHGMAAHHAEPWRQAGGAAPGAGFEAPSYANPPAYQSRNLYPQGQQIPMGDMGGRPKERSAVTTTDLGPAQAPRDMV
ncbi:hypothetical protein F5X68DRAFT_274539 [Plectosphaerella plurivora]|uniref:Cytochrome b561 domain-containing protein n=1 Tax=Plectosphaerella plurivora TaxID=936078 RepID=A0A9P8VEW2_9PEZI|nr:hypothetical protein F5X68DRAFT_274539 [Plectosphaerella plurivora]